MADKNLTYSITNIADESQYYIYPMAASLRGGAVESEFNIRNLMTCLFNKSSTKTESDFVVYAPAEYDSATNTYIRKPLETYEGNSWYTMNTDDQNDSICKISDIVVGAGEGNCNGYYIKLHEALSLDTCVLDITDLRNQSVQYSLCETIPVGEQGDFDIVTDGYKLKTGNEQKYFTCTGTNNYTVLQPGTTITVDTKIYIPTSVYKDFNILLALNWTTNQLVSSCNITVCEASKFDADKNYTSADTEYTTLTKAMQDSGLLDAGILLGTLRIKKSWVPDATNKNGSLAAEYNVVYSPNMHKTTCIDLTKLGTGNITLAEYLYDKLSRLYNLMVDNGSFKLGAVVSNQFEPNPDSPNHDFDSGISKYRVELCLNPAMKGPDGEITTNTASGCFRIINYDENRSETTPVSDIFSYELNIDRASGVALGVKKVSFLQDDIVIAPDAISVNSKFTLNNNTLYFGTGLSISAIDSETLQVPKISATEIKAGTINADKVYGAVWM